MYMDRTAASLEVHFRLNQPLPARRGGKAWVVELGDAETAADESVEAMNGEGKPELHCYRALVNVHDETLPLARPKPDTLVPMRLTIQNDPNKLVVDARIITEDQAPPSMRCR